MTALLQARMVRAAIAALLAAGLVSTVLVAAGPVNVAATLAAAAASAAVAGMAVVLGGQSAPASRPEALAEPVASGLPAARQPFRTVSAGGALPPLDAMLRFEEELGLAVRYGRPLTFILAGLDIVPGLDVEDAMAGLRQLIAGGVRRSDLITDRDATSVLVMAPETPAALGWVMVERVAQRVQAAGVGSVRFVALAAQPEDSLRNLLDELDGGLEVCRATDQFFADPGRMLAARP